MAAIFYMFSNASSWMKMFEFRLKFHYIYINGPWHPRNDKKIHKLNCCQNMNISIYHITLGILEYVV